MTTNPFENNIAIVTGAGSGIGRAISLELAIKGAKVMALGRNLQKLEKTKMLIEEQGGYAECYIADVTDKTVIDQAVEEIYNKHGRIDIFISNAGNATAPTHGTKMSIEDFDSVIKTHIYGMMYLVQACGERMKQRNFGRIVIISSLAGIYGLFGNISYAIAKTGLIGATYTLAKELGPYGITVNALQPGIINTPIIDELINIEGDGIIKDTPVGRIGRPEDVAHAASFLCMPQSEFITGIVMPVDGGYIINSGMDQIMNKFSQNI